MKIKIIQYEPLGKGLDEQVNEFLSKNIKVVRLEYYPRFLLDDVLIVYEDLPPTQSQLSTVKK